MSQQLLYSPDAHEKALRTSASGRHAEPATQVRNGQLPPARPRDISTVSCVVPCYNEADNLARLLPLLVDALSQCARAWEIILVDDGSTDGTPLLLASWARRPGIHMLQLSRNFGKEAAMTAGLQAARGDAVILMDADMQHSPDLIAVFMQRWRDGVDVVYAVRENRHDEGWLKRIGTGLFYRMVNAGGRFDLPAGAGDFRLMDRTVVDALLSLPERTRFMKGLYAWVGFEAEAVPYVPAARASGRSHFSVMKLVHLSIDGLTSFSTLPLRTVTLLGFAMAALSLTYGAFVTVSHLLYGNAVGGWTTIVAGLTGLAGIQLISLGVVGEYVGRIFEEVKARPLYVVKRELGQGLQVPR
jgi:glycosyltransferase involved in cell wall biosynthesis